MMPMRGPLSSQLEALLFVASKPLSFKKIAEMLHIGSAEVRSLIEELKALYEDRGVQVLEQGENVQLVSHPRYGAMTAALYRDEISGELTRPALETLTIIAYRGPIRKAELDQIRGVNCALILRNLQLRGLVDVSEVKERHERAYTISMDCLRHLGISKVQDLSDYEALHHDPTITALVGEARQEVL